MISSISFNLKISALQKILLRKLKGKSTIGEILTDIYLAKNILLMYKESSQCNNNKHTHSSQFSYIFQ